MPLKFKRLPQLQIFVGFRFISAIELACFALIFSLFSKIIKKQSIMSNSSDWKEPAGKKSEIWKHVLVKSGDDSVVSSIQSKLLRL